MQLRVVVSPNYSKQDQIISVQGVEDFQHLQNDVKRKRQATSLNIGDYDSKDSTVSIRKGVCGVVPKEKTLQMVL